MRKYRFSGKGYSGCYYWTEMKGLRGLYSLKINSIG